jgi:transcriptional regulator with XRE-family HTH domain
MSSDWDARKARGREQLRALRKMAGMTQEQVEQEAGLAARTLNRIERGTAGRANPEKVTLEAILRAISARYNDRRDVLALFDYTGATPLPDKDEIAQACQECHDDLHNVLFPAYVLDCAHRLLVWNRFLPPLIVSYVQDMEQLRGLHLTDILFGGPYQIANMVKNEDEFLPALLRVFYHASQPFVDETWYREYITYAINYLPRFKQYWDRMLQQGAGHTSGRLHAVAKLNHADAGELQFRIQVEQLTTDVRFRIVYYVPEDQHTRDQCTAWAE